MWALSPVFRENATVQYLNRHDLSIFSVSWYNNLINIALEADKILNLVSVKRLSFGKKAMKHYFADIFGVSERLLREYGAFNISLLTDLPLFIDPFLLFHSKKEEYRVLHDDMINYLRFLRDKSLGDSVSPGLLKSWYHFSEVKETWLGFCTTGNTGRGLGGKFARALHHNLRYIFSNFGSERVTKGSHLEKLCLIGTGIGRDMISDFTTNLIKDYLLTYTEAFAAQHINAKHTRKVAVRKVVFNYETETWQTKSFTLPFHGNEYVILTPKDMLTKDDTWISKQAFFREFDDIPNAIENDVLRAQINNYFFRMLPKIPKRGDVEKAIESTIRRFPELVDYFIKLKEQTGDQASKRSSLKVLESHLLYVDQIGRLIDLLGRGGFYNVVGNTAEETLSRIEYLKDSIEHKGGHRFFYVDGKPVRREEDLQLLFRLVWFNTSSDVSREVNDGRGPADFKISKGSQDKTLVEFKLASNSQLKRNLKRQLEIYQKASDAKTGYKVILYFSEAELKKVGRMLEELDLLSNPHIILVDARNDNKPSGSKA